MSDLPAPYAVPQYASKDPQRPSNGKIKLKVPPAHQSPPQTSTSTTANSPPQPQTTSLMLKVPAKEHAAQTRIVSPGPIAGPSTSSTSTAKTSSLANAQAPPATAQGRKSTTNNPGGQSLAVAEAAIAEITRAPALRSVTLTVTPTHRRLALDARDGVRNWSLRLAPSERGLRVSDVRLFRSEDSDDDDEGSEEEEEQGEQAEEEEEEEEGDEEDANSGGEGGDEEGGSQDSARARKKEVERVGRVKRPPPMRVRLDKTEVECRGRGRWEVMLGQGSGARVLELSDTRGGDGGKGVWRVYLHCTA
jgi:hypothetical protein